MRDRERTKTTVVRSIQCQWPRGWSDPSG